MSKNQQNYNLDITAYTLQELLELYDLPKRPTAHQIQQAKKKMLMMHPDKSRLPPAYFTFYKKAFDIVTLYYQDINKQSQPMTEEATTYQAPTYDNQQHIQQTVQQKQENGQFNNQFNQLFEEKGGVNKQRQERLKEQFGWFQQQDDTPYDKHHVKSAAGINAAFDSLRPHVQSIVVHRDYTPVTVATGVSYVDDEEEDQRISNDYIASDMFSKLKFDDIRRVHKDQTVLPVGEADYDKVQKYGSIEEYKQARSSQNLSALEKAKAEKIMQQQEEQRRNDYENRWSRMQKQTQQHEENNAQVLASFLLLGNNTTPGAAENARPPVTNAQRTATKGSASYINKSRTSCMR